MGLAMRFDILGVKKRKESTMPIVEGNIFFFFSDRFLATCYNQSGALH